MTTEPHAPHALHALRLYHNDPHASHNDDGWNEVGHEDEGTKGDRRRATDDERRNDGDELQKSEATELTTQT